MHRLMKFVEGSDKVKGNPRNSFSLRCNQPTGHRSVLLAHAVLAVALVATASSAEVANFAFVVDTSGSMVSYYVPRDPKPSLVEELLQSLVHETVRKGDRVVMLTFASRVFDRPGELVAISDANPSVVLSEMQRLVLKPQPGQGTVRSAAIGRAAKALQQWAPSPAVIFVITDRDNDVAPSEGTREDYDLAKQLEASKALQRVSVIPQGGMILEVWQLRGGGRQVAASSLDQTLATVKDLLRRIIPGRPLTAGPVALDFEQGGLSVHYPKAEWQQKRTPKGLVLEHPLEVKSRYRALHFRGVVMPQSEVLIDGKPFSSAKVDIVMDGAPVVLEPGSTAKGKILITGLKAPGFFQWNHSKVQMGGAVAAKGVATTEPGLFGVKDPVSEAKITGAIWMANSEPAVTTISPVPQPPTLTPPRAWQVSAAALVLLGLLALIFRWHGWPIWLGSSLGAAVGCAVMTWWGPVSAGSLGLAIAWSLTAWQSRKPKPLHLSYWAEDDAIPRSVSLARPGSEAMLSSVGVVLKRSGPGRNIRVCPITGTELLHASGQPTPELEIEGQGSFSVLRESESPRRVNISDSGSVPQPISTTDDSSSAVSDETPYTSSPEDEWKID